MSIEAKTAFAIWRTLPDSDPIWKDECFWKTKYVYSVEKQAELVEEIAYLKTDGKVGSLRID